MDKAENGKRVEGEGVKGEKKKMREQGGRR